MTTKKEELMFGRFSKNMILIFMGIIIGAWSITKDNLSRLDWAIIIIALFCIIWDFYNWVFVFLIDKNKLENASSTKNEQ